MATPAKVDPKPICKFGATCYRKNEQHLKQYRHPKRAHDEEEDDSPKKRKAEPAGIDLSMAEPTKKAKAGTIDQYFGKKTTKKESENEETTDASTSKAKPSGESEKESKESEEDKEDAPASDADDATSDEEEELEAPESPADVKQNIKSKYLVEMPDDFYDFWKLCKQLNPEDPLEALEDTLGLTLVGPYDVLAGRHKDVEKNSSGRRPNFLLHWRYYYDPPEFLTVVRGDSHKQFHLGYFRDVPSEMPVFVAANSAKENGIIAPKGDNLFAAVNFYIGEKLKDKALSGADRKSVTAVQDALKLAAEDGGHSLDLKTKVMKERDRKVVCKTFHGAGLVVPVDENEVGYRPVPETPADLKKILAKIRDSKTEAESDRNSEPLQEIITYIQFANDECDYGEGIELGLDLFTFGGRCFHSPLKLLLMLGYQLVKRPEYSKILAAHLKRRSHSADLSQID